MCHCNGPAAPAQQPKQSPEDLLHPKTHNTTNKTPLPNYVAQGIENYDVPPDDEFVEENHT